MRVLLVSLFLLFSFPIYAEQCEFEVTGSLLINPVQETANLNWKKYFKKREPLENITLRLSSSGKHGPFSQLAETKTDSKGRFKFEVTGEDKECRKKRRIRVSFRYTSSTINIKRSEQARPNRFNIYQSEEADVRFTRDVDLEKLVIHRRGKRDLGSETARQHGMIWLVYQRLNNYLDEISPGRSHIRYSFNDRFRVQYPHSRKIIRDEIKGVTNELSYANPINNSVLLVKNDKVNDLKVPVVVHELMHLWQYEQLESISYPTAAGLADFARNKTRGQSGMARYLVGNRNTHDEVSKEYVAFQEGFSWWFEEVANTEIFKIGKPTVLNKGWMNREIAKSLDKLDNHDVGWRQFFTVLTLSNPLSYEYGDSDTAGRLAKRLNPRVARRQMEHCKPKTFSVQHILWLYHNHLTVFNDDSNQKEKGPLNRKQMTLDGFFERAAFLNSPLAQYEAEYLRLLDPTNNEEYRGIFCRGNTP